VILLRSILFNILFYLNVVLHVLLAVPTLVMPYRAVVAVAKQWGRINLWLLRHVCNLRVEWRGREKIPPGGVIVASKHQSAWETFALYAMLDDPAYILKRELMWIPFFGWHMAKAGLIPIDRRAGMAALSRMTARARKELDHGRQVVIFPEGTRRLPGAEPSYKPGVAHLYVKSGVPCVPVALNSGLFWPRRSLLRYPGTILVEVLDPIPQGLSSREFLARLQDALEPATTHLVQESEMRHQGQGSGKTGTLTPAS